ncbi:MAG: M81 family metallopeptidase [Pseudomonadota bacterium]
MNLFAAQFSTETNTFISQKTTRAAFEERGVTMTDASLRPSSPSHSVLRFFRRAAEADGHAYCEGIAASAEPGGPLAQQDYEAFRDTILRQAEGAAPDVVLLILHGAMVSEDEMDCEGDILRRLRRSLGSRTVIAAMLDPHAHLSDDMVNAADLLISMKEYPHTDGLQTAQALYRLATAAARGDVRPRMAMHKVPVLGVWPTQKPEIRRLVDHAKQTEQQPGILSVSFIHGFPWGDTPDMGAKALVIADGNTARAEAEADRYATAIWRAREASQPHFLTFPEAISAAQDQHERPAVIADTADNPGGGAPGDSTYALHALIDAKTDRAIVTTLNDPDAVAACFSAGVGVRLALSIGGKHKTLSGVPVSGEAVVLALNADLRQTGFDLEAGVAFGRAALIEIKGVHVILSARRAQTLSPDVLTNMGVAAADYQIIIVKSTNHFYEYYSKISTNIVFATSPGALTCNFADMPYEYASTSYWPRISASDSALAAPGRPLAP